MTITLSALQKQRRDTAANWTAENPTLLAGEIGIEADTGKIKIGNGSSAWASLGYQGIIPASGTYPLNQLIMPLGTAGAPPLTFTGDVNTGIYSPGADQVAISTNGTGRLFVDASGNVGIGVTSPGARLDVSSSTQVALFRSSNALCFLRCTSTGGGDTAFGSDANGGFFSVVNNLPLALKTNDAERLRITSAGLVGVGTSSPGALLDVVGGVGRIRTGGKAGSNTYLLLESTDASNTMALSVSNSTNANWQIQAVENGVSYRPLILNPSGGNVGIGTTSPQTPLHVSTANSEQGRFESTGASYINVKGSAGQNLLGVEPGAGWVGPIESIALAFKTGNSERARIDSSGRLLVGTSSALDTSLIGAAAFQVAGGTNATSQLSVSRFSGNSDLPRIALIKSRSGTVGSNTIVQNGDGLGEVAFIGADGSGATGYPFAASIGAYVDGTPGANDMPGRLVFSTTADGASSPTERMRLNNTGVLSVYGNGDAVFARSGAAAGTASACLTAMHSATSTTAGTTSLRIYTNGNVENTNNSYGAFSDAKLKENIVDATSQWSDIKALQVRKYNFKEGQTHTQIGLVAQEVELVSPGLVSESPDRDAEGNDLGTVTKSVNYSVLYMKAVKALQEAMERIEQLEQRLTDAGIA